MLQRNFCSAVARATRCLFLGLALAPLMAAHADQLEQHKQLVDQFIQQRHADPLVADCAAHASFVVSTAPGYASVEFPDNAFDAEHAHVEPWQKPFDNAKQKLEVATVVTLDGIGDRTKGGKDTLHIRCGYNDGRLMAFNYTSPLPQVEPVRHTASRHHARHGKVHGHVASSAHGKRHATASTHAHTTTAGHSSKHIVKTASHKKATKQPE